MQMDDPTCDTAGVRPDALAGKVLAELLASSHLMPPGGLTDLIVERAAPFGVQCARIYLADLEERNLNPIPCATAPTTSGLSIDSTLAGRVFRTRKIHHTTVRPAASDGEGPYRVWVPLVDGIERLGVLELVVADADQVTLDRCRTLASLAGLIIASKRSYSDTYNKVRRSRDMALQAEMVWAFMPPPTFGTEQVLVAATIEPAYEVGGDAFDYSLLGDRMHLAVFDAVGHDLASGLIASVAMASCRNTRRAGGGLTEIVGRADHAIASQFGSSRFATALLCELDVGTGQLSWISCGHPPPLLIRGHKVVKELFRKPQLPLGLGDRHDAEDLCVEYDPPVHTEQLQPGDHLLLYTDGVIEGRAANGTPFGLERLSDFVIRYGAAGLPAPETLRRLNRAILDYQHGRLSDDATTVLVEWMPDDPWRRLTS